MQVDFNLPQRFDITYVDSNSEKKRPIMIHRAVLGSLERFFGVLIEHYAGDFPLWLSPVQAHVLPVTDTQVRKVGCTFNVSKNSTLNTYILFGFPLKFEWLNLHRIYSFISRVIGHTMNYELVIHSKYIVYEGIHSNTAK